MVRLNKLIMINLFIIIINFTPVIYASSTMTFKAIIGDDITGCDIILPETTLTFKPLHAKDIVEPASTFQINKLSLQLFCEDEVKDIIPSITLKGSTPYGYTDAIFLNGEPNGVGFMVRKNNGNQPSLGDFYNIDDAIKNNDYPLSLNILGNVNSYYSVEDFWVGLVGPLSDTIKPGPFSATLIININFR